MIKINLIAVGKVKEKYFLDGIAEYVKRLNKFCEFKLIEVAEENFNKPSDSQIEIIKEREAERILPKIQGKVFSLAIEGEKLDSVKFSKLIKTASDKEGVITFIIGGSYGLSEKVKKVSSLISFGDITFPHTLFRLILTEQIYRAFTIIEGTPYHK